MQIADQTRSNVGFPLTEHPSNQSSERAANDVPTGEISLTRSVPTTPPTPILTNYFGSMRLSTIGSAFSSMYDTTKQCADIVSSGIGYVATQAGQLLTPVEPAVHDNLIEAAKSNRLEDLKSALDSRASLKHQDEQGHTALHHAAHNGHIAITRELLSRGASAHSLNREKSTPAHVAAKSSPKSISSSSSFEFCDIR